MYFHAPSYTLIHTHTHCRPPSLLVRTLFPDPSCEDTLLHSSYPNHAWVFISLLLGLSNHLIEINKGPVFFVGTLMWGLRPKRYLWVHIAVRLTCGDCILDGTYGFTWQCTLVVGSCK